MGCYLWLMTPSVSPPIDSTTLVVGDWWQNKPALMTPSTRWPGGAGGPSYRGP